MKSIAVFFKYFLQYILQQFSECFTVCKYETECRSITSQFIANLQH